MGKLKRHTATFIIRLWAEYLDQEPPTYRGEIESVTSSQKIAFGDLSVLVTFLQEQASPISQTSEVE